jgi:hypothetical protein
MLKGTGILIIEGVTIEDVTTILGSDITTLGTKKLLAFKSYGYVLYNSNGLILLLLLLLFLPKEYPSEELDESEESEELDESCFLCL